MAYGGEAKEDREVLDPVGAGVAMSTWTCI
jgi:hypothetical protein